MARVRPFAAYRYACAKNAEDISALTAPPYDVISPAQREDLLGRDEHNAVALELPSGTLDPEVPGNRYETGSRTWRAWRDAGVIAQDASPRLYVLEQRFDHEGHTMRRKAIIAEVALEPFEAGVVLPHERTLPKALGDRFELLLSTGANLSQVFALYNDPARVTDAIFETAMATEPLTTATDDDGVTSTLWATASESAAELAESYFADQRLFIADGHHRYTVALAYRDLRRRLAAENPSAPPAEDPAYDYVMMALANMDDPGLLVLPTHRIADAPGAFDSAAFWQGLAEHFEVGAPAPLDTSALEDASRPSFLVKTRDDELPRLVSLREDVDLDAAIPLSHSDAWKNLDVAVLQELVLNRLLDVHPDRAETLERLKFAKCAEQALAMTAEHDAAFVLRATRMDQLRAVALAGETMPQKSTYFYPKLLSGLAFRNAE
ncbi:MAG: DUF1015 domain-containing protein [Coriobacteriia bacterium]